MLQVVATPSTTCSICGLSGIVAESSKPNGLDQNNSTLLPATPDNLNGFVRNAIRVNGISSGINAELAGGVLANSSACDSPCNNSSSSGLELASASHDLTSSPPARQASESQDNVDVEQLSPVPNADTTSAEEDKTIITGSKVGGVLISCVRCGTSGMPIVIT